MYFQNKLKILLKVKLEAFITKKVIHINLVRSITPRYYEKYKYSLLLINNETCTIIKFLIRKKSQIKTKLLKYTENMYI